MTQDLEPRFREAFAADLTTAPLLTLRQADAIGSYGTASSRDEVLDAVTDSYLEKYAAGLLHLDSASWRHYLPAIADFAQRHLGSPTVVVGTFLDSLGAPESDLPRLGSLSDAQAALARELLEMLAFSPESTWQTEACEALAEWWIENPQSRAKAGQGGGV